MLSTRAFQNKTIPWIMSVDERRCVAKRELFNQKVGSFCSKTQIIYCRTTTAAQLFLKWCRDWSFDSIFAEKVFYKLFLVHFRPILATQQLANTVPNLHLHQEWQKLFVISCQTVFQTCKRMQEYLVLASFYHDDNTTVGTFLDALIESNQECTKVCETGRGPLFCCRSDDAKLERI